MNRGSVDVGAVLDAAADIIIADGFHEVTLAGVAQRSGTNPDAVLELFGSFDDVLVSMLNREFASMYASIVDQIERDPRGGLLSRMYLYILSSVYERPLAKVLYTVDPDALGTIMRNSKSYGYVPSIGVRADLIEAMQRAGMVRRDVDAPAISHAITTFSAGLAITAPHEDLDLIVAGICDLIAKAADTDAEDTSGGKAAFYEWATSLTFQR